MLNMGRRGGSFDAIRVTLLDLCKQLGSFCYILCDESQGKDHFTPLELRLPVPAEVKVVG